MRRLRATARAALPSRAILKRDRGDFLLVTNAPCFQPEITSLPGFYAERRGALLFLLPDASWLARFERSSHTPDDALCKSLARFKGVFADTPSLKLWAWGAKLLDTALSEAEIARFERALRQRAAVALRGGYSGGGLYAAALLCARLHAKDDILQ